MRRTPARRIFRAAALAAMGLSLPSCGGGGPAAPPRDAVRSAEEWRRTFRDPPRDYTLVPLWFWNDALSEDEIVRQIDDFVAHGVYGFLIHPRIGLPDDVGFMSDRYLHFVRVAVEHAAKRGLRVHLYDEGMYPSGSACGQVVAENPAFAARCIIPREVPAGAEPALEPGERLVTVQSLPDGRRIAVVDAPSLGRIRGIHYGEDEGEPNQPPAADLLNEDAVAAFMRLVHERYHQAVGAHFGKTIRAIFTDEPTPLGRKPRPDAMPWTGGLEADLERRLGYDVRPRLPALWFDLGGSTSAFRRDFQRAVLRRLGETYYGPIGRWCEAHGIALTGHPSAPDEIGSLRHFQIPGQDVVWRYVEPGKPTALEPSPKDGNQCALAKCASSAAAHLGRARNGVEAFGAYGWNFTYDEMRWLSDWMLVRGVNLLSPHAFYYSVRGDRRDERPPDVGPHNTWWPEYRSYADYVRRACWLLATGTHRADIAILGRYNSLPFAAAKACFQRQRDFNYLEDRHLRGDVRVFPDRLEIGAMAYRALVIDDDEGLDDAARASLAQFIEKNRVVRYQAPAAPADAQAPTSSSLSPSVVERGVRTASSPQELIAILDALAPPDFLLRPPNPDLRYRRVAHPGREVYLLFNEGEKPVRGTVEAWPPSGRRFVAGLADGVLAPVDGPFKIDLPPHATTVLVVEAAP